MSATNEPSALLIAATTVLLRDLLGERLMRHGLASLVGDVTVSTLPPDRIAVGSEERTQLNVFLYRVTPNTRWRGGPLSTNGDGRPPLALDLHYLLTAYGEQDLHIDLLLGYAVQALNSTAVLTHDAVRTTLNGGGGTEAGSLIRTVLGGSDLLTQLQRIEIVPEFLGMEELSRLWSALQARYRPSVTYKVTAALLDASRVDR